jgi:hypothetical protein
MRVLEHKTIIIDFFPDDYFFLVKRFDSDDESDTNYKTVIDEWRQVVEKYKPKKQLIDYSDYSYKISSELQQYTFENLLKPSHKVGVRKVAFLIAHDLFAQMSVEEIMKKDTGEMFEFRYFDDFQKSKEWLLN